MTVDRADRILGCLLGGAIGDALGAHYGASALRADWRERVELADVITDMAGRLAAVGGNQ
jgi:ADP-ribosylglycohydrolase